MTHIKQLGKDVIIYGFGHVLKRSMGFLLIPIYTRYLSPADYGYLELLNIMLTVLIVILSQGMGTSFFRSYVDSPTDSGSALKVLMSTSYNYLLILSILVCALLYMNAESIAGLLLGKDGSFVILIQFVVATLFFQTIALIPFQLFRANLESAKFVVISVMQFFIQVSLCVYFVVVLRMSIEGVLLAGVISSCCAALFTFFLVRKNLNFTMHSGTLKSLLAYGLPLIPAGLAFWIISASDRFMLQELATTHELGLYTLGSRLSNILTFMVVAPFQTAWGPILFQIAAKENGREIFKKITTYFLLILCLLGMAIIVAMPVVIKFIAGREFWEAQRVVLPLVYANIAAGMFLICKVGIYVFKKTRYSMYITAVGALLNIGLNLAFIPRFGMMGAAASSLFSWLIIMGMAVQLSGRLYHIPYEGARIFKICAIFTAVTGVSYILHFQSLYWEVFSRLGLMALFCSSLFWLDFFNAQDKTYMKRLWAGLQRRKSMYSRKLGLGINFMRN
jgi:O-antigen/teichoic acid export membrane protein